MPTFYHTSVLREAVLQALRPHSQGRYVDGTVGGGGHMEAILEASAPGGWVDGFDRDREAIEATRERLRAYEGRFELHHANYDQMERWVAGGSCDGILLDLGVSSHQLDCPERGFSFQQDGPLDMRMDTSQTVTAASLVNGLSEAELARIFSELGDEPQARRFARALVRERQAVEPFKTTGQLARCLERLAPRMGRKRHPATRVFMALRMAVNEELSALQSAMAAACPLLRPGGRLAVITFHSVEDRAVKRFGQAATRAYQFPGEVDVPELRVPCQPRFRWVTRKPVEPAAEEVAANPRARSAKLRVLEKI